MAKRRPTRSEVMRAVKSRDTGPERKVAELLAALSVESRRDVADLPGRPDFVVERVKRGHAPIVIFVHGCWWHAHDCPRGDRPAKTNRAYWRAKIDRNRRRDRRVARRLRALGFSVWTVWECRLRRDGLPGRLVGRLARVTRR